MAYCRKCGTQLSDGAKFCPKCGNAIGFRSQIIQQQKSEGLWEAFKREWQVGTHHGLHPIPARASQAGGRQARQLTLL